MSSIFCFRSLSENPFTCNILICFTMVDLPDSPAPSSNSLCRVIASLRRFWLLVSSELFESDCFDPAEPKQPIADQGAHQQVAPPSGDVSGDSAPRASPLRASV
uniref:Uncharacterized protein n=1 Tax=Anopheles coluzzii TaxID=1518534 RepID=A0A8W7P832_ANOCL